MLLDTLRVLRYVTGNPLSRVVLRLGFEKHLGGKTRLVCFRIYLA